MRPGAAGESLELISTELVPPTRYGRNIGERLMACLIGDFHRVEHRAPFRPSAAPGYGAGYLGGRDKASSGPGRPPRRQVPARTPLPGPPPSPADATSSRERFGVVIDTVAELESFLVRDDVRLASGREWPDGWRERARLLLDRGFLLSDEARAEARKIARAR